MAPGKANDPSGTVPVTVLGGYLGAGKTSLINDLLARAVDTRIVVVVNDFGSVNIDAELISSRSGGTLELANGCICCDLSGGMPAVMAQIAKMAPPPDQVLIEVSGVGDPGPVAAWGDHPGFRRGGTLVCADVETIQQKAHGRWVADTVMHQLESADLLLLTKTDLVDAAQVRQVRTWLHQSVPGVKVLDLHQIDPLDLLNQAGAGAGSPTVNHPDSPAVPGGHLRHTSISLFCDAPVDREHLSARLAALPDSVVRAKGVIRTSDAPTERTILHTVGRRHTWQDGGRWTSADPTSRVVLIATPSTGDELEEVVRAWSPDWSQLAEPGVPSGRSSV